LDDELSSYYSNLATLEDVDDGLTLGDCINADGELYPELYARLLKMEDNVASADNVLLGALSRAREKEDASAVQARPSKRRRNRSAKTLRIYYFDDNRQMVFLKSKETFWYLSYVRSPPTEDKKWQAKFRQRFRLPHSEFLVMLDRLAASGKFTRWYGKDAVGIHLHP
jgi:hypothetical protein